ncbi:ABC transporter permease [Corynebacterium yudongzhengii]|uniref:ABC transporter permease n=1 Tax=Corynebacterium yudongzhengii TaxID=2080740 RepID=A0A2U1T489_9CORY|nr:FtsX-like permease family protein [Corynebacterium yudongzhengii]AWB82569.1 ABC transporter permease [Corynebacterium yudongzhengii]PWC00708.1 ABC transporter permease [Corynebacterium yudongzhengii]
MAHNTMRKVSLRNIAAHKLRLALTILAVVLGTAFISGAFMFTNSLSKTFDAVVEDVYADVDVVVGGEPTPEDRDAIAADENVDNVNITSSRTVVLATGTEEDPEPLQTGGGNSALSIWYDPDDVVGDSHELVEGEAPQGAEEVAINASAAEEYGLEVGEELLVVDSDERSVVTVTGLWDSELYQGTNVTAYMEEQPYLDNFAPTPPISQLIVEGVEGIEDQELVDHLASEFPDLKIETGEQLAETTSQEVQNALSFVNYFLVAFGLIALLVGTFLIANTFSMIVAQRTKEFALLRALGASRGQITRSVTFEAVIIGLIGSAIGVVVGIGLVAVIKAFLATQGMEMPDSGLGLSWQAIVVPVVLGTVVTVVSAWAPACRAGQVEPVEAMRSSESATSQPLKARTIVGAVVVAAAIVAAAIGVLFDDWSTAHRAIAVGVGAVGVIVGFFLVGPALSLPIVPTFGRLIGLPFGAIGKLASTNTRRNPRRTSTTAFALALGIALVTAIGMFGASMKSAIDDVLENNFTADYVLTGPQQGVFPVPAEAPKAAANTEGVESAIIYSAAPVAIDGEFPTTVGPEGGFSDVSDGDPAELIVLEGVEGSTDLSDGGMIAPEAYAEERGWTVGETYELSAPGISPETAEIELIGTFGQNEVLSNPMVSTVDVSAVIPPEMMEIIMIGVTGDGSVEHEELRANLEEEMAQFIVVQVMDGEEMAGLANQMIDQMLSILYALLALAVIIAILGIVNTLTLSVIERRQEIGMLRAVGSQRGQVRTMIMLEAVQIALFGAVSGIVMGLGLGWAFIEVLEDQGLSNAIVPWDLLGVVLIGALIVGLIAAIWPAGRAAKTPPLDAIAD